MKKKKPKKNQTPKAQYPEVTGKSIQVEEGSAGLPEHPKYINPASARKMADGIFKAHDEMFRRLAQ